MLITPSYKDYLDYKYNFNVPWDATLEIEVFSFLFFASVLYSMYLQDNDIRPLALIGLLCYIVNNIFNILLF